MESEFFETVTVSELVLLESYLLQERKTLT